MRRLVHLAVLAALAYFGYTWLLPRVEAYRETLRAEERADDLLADARICVGTAEGLSGDLARGLRQFGRPPVDPGSWSTFMIRTAGELASADSTCACPAEACRSAAAALLEMRRTLNRFDAWARGESGGMKNFPAGQETIDRLLARARAELAE